MGHSFIQSCLHHPVVLGRNEESCLVCDRALQLEVAITLVSTVWIWLVSIECVLNKQVSFLAMVADIWNAESGKSCVRQGP